MKNKYSLTVLACYIGYIIQAIVNNLSPLLFAQFSNQFSISPSQITIIVIVNFSLQILVDSQSATIALKFGYRKSAVVSQFISALGLVLLGVLPNVMHPFAGILIATFFLAIGGGFIEVVLSPLMEALPLKNKSGAMCLLHSFYCWGHIFVVIVATIYFNLFTISNWMWLPIALVIIPIINGFIFSKCPIETLNGDDDPMPYKSIFKMKNFIVFLLLMVAAGAAEQAVAQWASYFAEISLGISNKTIGDLLGTCLFALGMALSRTFYGFFGDKINLKKAIAICASFLFGAYMLTSFSPIPYLSLAGIAMSGIFVGIMWPGIYSLAGKTYKNGGTKMFGMLALGGDLGCTLGPSLVGFISSDLKIGLCLSGIFPIILILGVLIISKQKQK